YCFEIFDRDHRSRTVLTEPGISAVAYDAQHPGTGTATAELSDGAKGAQRRILHHILGVRTIARQPVRQSIGIVDVWKHDVRKARIVVTRADPARGFAHYAAGNHLVATALPPTTRVQRDQITNVASMDGQSYF